MQEVYFSPEAKKCWVSLRIMGSSSLSVFFHLSLTVLVRYRLKIAGGVGGEEAPPVFGRATAYSN